MEPDDRNGEEMPAPTGITFGLDPERVIAKLQARSAQMIQNLQWELATRDALVEVMEQRLNESEQLRQEAEGAIQEYVAEALEHARELEEARVERDKALREPSVENSMMTRDAFLEAAGDADTLETARVS